MLSSKFNHLSRSIKPSFKLFIPKHARFKLLAEAPTTRVRLTFLTASATNFAERGPLPRLM